MRASFSVRRFPAARKSLLNYGSCKQNLEDLMLTFYVTLALVAWLIGLWLLIP